MRHHSVEAARESQIAAGLERQVAERNRARDALTITNNWRAGKREVLQQVTDAARAAIAHSRALRAKRAKTMTPEQVDRADAARDAFVKEQARKRRLTEANWRSRRARQGPGRDFSAPGIDRDGPDLGL